MITTVRWAEHVEKVFFLPSAEGILRMVAMMNTQEKKMNRTGMPRKIITVILRLVTLMEMSAQANFCTAQVEKEMVYWGARKPSRTRETEEVG